MPISTSLYTQLRFTISDYAQRREWKRLLEAIGSEDDEVSKMIAVIMGAYDSRNTWDFVDYCLSLSPERRGERRTSVKTICYIISRMGNSNVKKSLSYLKKLLLEDSSLKEPVSIALSNLWVMDTKTTSLTLMRSWILDKSQNEMLQQVAVGSCEYLASNEPNRVLPFLSKISSLGTRKVAAKIAHELLKKYPIRKKAKAARVRKLEKKLKKGKKNKKNRE